MPAQKCFADFGFPALNPAFQYRWHFAFGIDWPNIFA
jgi:hypothetical protein